MTEKERNAKFQHEKQRMYALNLNIDRDAEVMEWLEKHRPYATYLRNLVIADMRENGVDILDRDDGRLKTGDYIGFREKYKKKEQD